MLCDASAKRLHLLPIGKLDGDGGFGGTLRDLHDQLDHEPVKEGVGGIVQPAGKDLQDVGPPLDLFQELDHVGVGVRGAFFGFPRDQVDGEEGRMDLFQFGLMVGVIAVGLRG